MPIFRREDGKLEAVPGNYAILDDSGQVPMESLNIAVEQYYNHLGNVDNLMELVETGNATGTENAADHSMDLNTGLNATGYAMYRTKKTWVLDENPLVCNFLVNNIVIGDPLIAVPTTMIGLLSGAPNFTGSNFTVSMSSALGVQWWADSVIPPVQHSSKHIADLVDGDLITFEATNTQERLFVNGALLWTNFEYIPTVPLHVSTAVAVTNATLNVTAQETGIDLISINKYY